MEKIRKEFPVTRKGIYANTAVYGPLYDSLLDWRQEHDLDFLLHGSEMRGRSLKILSDTRNTVGTFFNCKRENVSLVSNLSTGLNFLLEGLKSKTKVLLMEDDYPSLNWSFENRDFDISYVKMDVDVEQHLNDVIVTNKIEVLALSLVQWLDGFFIDLEFIKKLKEEHPNLIIIADGTQFCGARSFDFEASGIDVLGASAYKWLLSGYGNGFMLFSDAVQERFSLNTIGFNAANGDLDKMEDIRFAKKFEPGHLSCLNFGSLQFSLNFLTRIGMDAITDHNKQLSLKAKQAFTESGLLKPHIVSRENQSTIFNIEGNDKVFNTLIENNVLCAQRGNGIRLSFHFYNIEDEVDEIVRIVKTVL
jgi:selenocysteine lyase/cysteine desulfurase